MLADLHNFRVECFALFNHKKYLNFQLLLEKSFYSGKNILYNDLFYLKNYIIKDY